MTREQTWERLCGLVAEDPAVLDDVREALAEGEDTAGVWQVFLSGLDDAGELAYLKASDGPMELEAALAQLPRVVRADVDLESVGDVDGDLAAGVDVAEEVLAEVDLATVHLPRTRTPTRWPWWNSPRWTTPRRSSRTCSATSAP